MFRRVEVEKEDCLQQAAQRKGEEKEVAGRGCRRPMDLSRRGNRRIGAVYVEQ